MMRYCSLQRIEISAYAVLFTGITLLVFTFINAYLFLIEELGVIASSDMLKAFGEALGPLVVASIRVMFLGVMGWISSIITARGVQLLTQSKRETKQEFKTETETKTMIKKGSSTNERYARLMPKPTHRQRPNGMGRGRNPFPVTVQKRRWPRIFRCAISKSTVMDRSTELSAAELL